MDSQITKDTMRAYIARWKLVNDREIRELRQTSYLQKFKQLNALMQSVKQMGWDDALKAEEAPVRERWNRLRKAYDGSTGRFNHNESSCPSHTGYY